MEMPCLLTFSHMPEELTCLPDWLQEEVFKSSKVWFLMNSIMGYAPCAEYTISHTIFYLAPFFSRCLANSLATNMGLRNLLKGGLVLVIWMFICLLQEILLFDVSNWICFKIGCLNSENLPPPPAQPIQRSWWLLMSFVEISTLITAPLVR